MRVIIFSLLCRFWDQISLGASQKTVQRCPEQLEGGLLVEIKQLVKKWKGFFLYLDKHNNVEVQRCQTAQ